MLSPGPRWDNIWPRNAFVHYNRLEHANQRYQIHTTRPAVFRYKHHSGQDFNRDIPIPHNGPGDLEGEEVVSLHIDDYIHYLERDDFGRPARILHTYGSDLGPPCSRALHEPTFAVDCWDAPGL